MADLGLEKGTEVSRLVSQLRVLFALWPEEDTDQNAGKLKTAQGPRCSQVRMEETDSVPRCLHRPDPQLPRSHQTAMASAVEAEGALTLARGGGDARTNLERDPDRALGRGMNHVSKWCDPDATR